jgi:hypothetical protein
VFSNQESLASSEFKLDAQFCVLTRLTITTLNQLIQQMSTVRDFLHLPPTLGVAPKELDYAYVNRMFQEWEQFRSRPDFREHFKTWFMGEDLSRLPLIEPVPEVPNAESATPEAPEPVHGEPDVPNLSGENSPDDGEAWDADMPEMQQDSAPPPLEVVTNEPKPEETDTASP